MIVKHKLAFAVGIAVGVVLTLAGLAAVVALTGGRDSPTNKPARPAPARRTFYTLRAGDVVRDPLTATRCEASQEGGFPNLFCTRTARGRYQIVFYEDSVLVFDLQDPNREPLEPTYSFKWKTRRPTK